MKFNGFLLFVLKMASADIKSINDGNIYSLLGGPTFVGVKLMLVT